MSTNVINLDETAKNSNSSSMKIFNSPEFGTVRTIIIEGEPWFVGKDIASILAYQYTANAIQDHVDKEDKKKIQLSDIQDMDILSIPPHMKGSKITIINESGLYSLILRSNMPKAKEFKRWVTSEILPSIRKTGSYSITQEVSKPAISPEELELKKLEAEARLIEAKNKTAEMFLSIGDRTSIPEYKQILDSYAANTLAGKEILALPEAYEKTYSATEIGKILGVSANKIGKLANQYNLKIPEFGKLFYDKSRYSNKEVETFRYYNKAIDKFRELLK